MKRLICIFSLCVLSSAVKSECLQSGNTITCNSALPNPWTKKLGSPEGVYPIPAFDNFSVNVEAGSIVELGNSSAISLGNNANITISGAVSNAASSASGSYSAGGNTVEFNNGGTLLINSTGSIIAQGSQRSSEAVNVIGTGNTITNRGLIQTLNNAAIWIQNPSGAPIIHNYGTIAAGGIVPSNTNSAIGGGSPRELHNYSGASVYGSLIFYSGPHDLYYHTGSLITGNITAPATNPLVSLHLKGPGSQTLTNKITGFTNLYKEDIGTWTISNPLAPMGFKNVQVQAGTLILTADNSAFVGSPSPPSVASGAVLQAPALGMPGQLITNNGLVQFNEPTTGTYAGAISGSGSVEKIGPGVTTLTGNHTFTGPTTVTSGVLQLTGSLQSPTTIQAGASLNNLGTINNTVNNSGTLNLNGSPTVTGAIAGPGTVNVNGTFSQSNTIGAGQLNVTSGSTLTMTNSISAPTLIQGGGLINVMGSQNLTGNLTNNGSIDLISSGTILNVNGIYAQSGGADIAIYINGVSPGSYSQIISTQPIDIASGAIINGTLNPRLFLEPGVIIPGVISGQGTPTQAGDIVLNIPSNRFNLRYRYNGGNVDLVLPLRRTINIRDFDSDEESNIAGTYIGALASTTEATIQQLIQPTTRVLNNVYAIFYAVMEYDCDQFDKAGFCIWGGARVSNMSGHTQGSGVLNIAYRLTESTRIGAVVDSRGSISSSPVSTTEPSPFVGLYAGYSQTGYSQKEINRGVQVFLSTGYYSGELSINRPLIRSPLLPQFIDSQPGLGHPSLTAYFLRSLLGYGFDFAPNARLMPYLGLRYTDVTRNAYTENFTEMVLQPLQFNPYFERLVTSFGGLTFDGSLTQKLGSLLGIGVELDVSRSNPDFSGSSPLPIENLTTFNYVQSTSRNNFRPTAMAGLYYEPKTNHRISATGYFAQQPNVSKTYSNYVLRYELIF